MTSASREVIARMLNSATPSTLHAVTPISEAAARRALPDTSGGPPTYARLVRGRDLLLARR
jgi:hypothetical protein